METIEHSECKCSSLLDYVKWYYNTLTDIDGFEFISDNQTSIGGHAAHVLNYKTSKVGSLLDTLSIFTPHKVTEFITTANNAFYRLKYFGLEGYSTHLDELDTILKSVNFLSLENKKPSFLN